MIDHNQAMDIAENIAIGVCEDLGTTLPATDRSYIGLMVGVLLTAANTPLAANADDNDIETFIKVSSDVFALNLKAALESQKSLAGLISALSGTSEGGAAHV